MAKRNLLSEAQVRQFMKYANITPLADGFIKENYGMEDEVYDTAGLEHEQGGEDDSAHLKGLDEEWHEELDEEEDLEAAAPAADEGTVKDILAAIVDGIKSKFPDIDISLDGAAEAAPADMGGEEGADLDLGGDEDADLDLGGDEEEMEMGDEEGDEEEEEEMDLDEVVAQISERVVRRVKALKESKPSKAAAGRRKIAEARRARDVARRAEAITERILNRITKNR